MHLLNTSSRVLSTELYVTLHRERTQQVVMFCLVYKVQNTSVIHKLNPRHNGEVGWVIAVTAGTSYFPAQHLVPVENL